MTLAGDGSRSASGDNPEKFKIEHQSSLVNRNGRGDN